MNTFDKCRTPMERYMHKFVYERKSIKRLKWHEKDFLFNNMRILRDSHNKRAYDIFSIEEARDYAFNLLILIYTAEKRAVIDFSRNAYDYDGFCISDKERKRHKTLFDGFMRDWSRLLDKGNGPYLMVLTPLFNRKQKELKDVLKDSNPTAFSEKEALMKALFFHIMYKVRLYFDEKPQSEKYDRITINDIDVYADIYTYCHVLTRHYYPGMNNIIGGSLNEDISIIDLNNLPMSLLSLVLMYNNINPITSDTQYLLFELQQSKYIMWLKYGRTNYSEKKGFRICSFYKCEEKKDLDRFSNNKIPICNEAFISV